MLDNLLNIGKYGTLFCGIEHSYIDGQEKLNSLLLKKNKDEFLIENSSVGSVVSELKSKLPKGQHLFLIINDNKVLSKEIKGSFNPQKAIAQAFPNINSEEFYYEVYAQDENTFISICRKDHIDTISNEYKSNQLNVTGFSLGNLVISQLANIIEESNITTSNSTILFADKKIKDMIPIKVSGTNTYTINGLQFTNTTILPLAGIISYYTNQQITVSNFTTTLVQLQNDFKQKWIFAFGLKTGLSIIFLLLLTSFMFFSSYTSNINAVTTELQLNQSYKNQFIKLSEEVNKKERLVKDFSLTFSKASWYLDQIGSSIPNSILLSNIDFQPILKSIKKDEEILFQKNVIAIKGNSVNSTDFSNWINTLEQLNWIENVVINEFGTGKKTTTEFELQIEFSK